MGFLEMVWELIDVLNAFGWVRQIVYAALLGVAFFMLDHMVKKLYSAIKILESRIDTLIKHVEALKELSDLPSIPGRDEPAAAAESWRGVSRHWSAIRNHLEKLIQRYVDAPNSSGAVAGYKDLSRHNYEGIVRRLAADGQINNHSESVLLQMNSMFFVLRLRVPANYDTANPNREVSPERFETLYNTVCDGEHLRINNTEGSPADTPPPSWWQRFLRMLCRVLGRQP